MPKICFDSIGKSTKKLFLWSMRKCTAAIGFCNTVDLFKQVVDAGDRKREHCKIPYDRIALFYLRVTIMPQM